MNFWDPWQLWAKMVFILGCLIAVVFIYALIIRFRNKRKTKRLAEEDELAQAEKGDVSTSDPRTSDDVPFGIRAIEQGCKVEGVWISNTNTPLQTPRSSRASSTHSTPRSNDNSTGPAKLTKANRKASISCSQQVQNQEPPRPRRQSRGRYGHIDDNDAEMVENVSKYERGVSATTSAIQSEPHDHSLGIQSKEVNKANSGGNEYRSNQRGRRQSRDEGCASSYRNATRSRTSEEMPRGIVNTRPTTKRSFSEGRIFSAAEGTLHQLDACRNRQAETGQLVPRSARQMSKTEVLPKLTRTESEPLGHEAHTNLSQGPSNRNSVSSHEMKPYKHQSREKWTRHSIGASESTSSALQHTIIPGKDIIPPTDVGTLHRLGLAGTSHINTSVRRIHPGFEVLPVGSLESSSSIREWGTAETAMQRWQSSDAKGKKLQKRRRSASVPRG